MKKFKGLNVPPPDPHKRAFRRQKKKCDEAECAGPECYSSDCYDCIFGEDNLDEFLEWEEWEREKNLQKLRMMV